MVKTRLAPSPTGPLHIGTARTALFNYLFAKQNQGQFLLRIEDTDIQRSKKEFENDIIRHLHWLGLKPDHDPVHQSNRTELYRRHLEQLLGQGRAFWCYHSPEEIQKQADQAKKQKRPPVHWCSHRQQTTSNKQPSASKAQGIIRFATPRNYEIKFKDEIRGEIKVNTENIGDFSIAKNLNTPLYNLAVVIDDHLMEISHVIRGEDHLPNTPKQILLYQAFGWHRPVFAHLPLILGSDKSKLSKRHGATAIAEYRKQGYLPQALINFMALLGWHPSDEREYFTIQDLIKEFSLKRVKKSGAIFNQSKLDDINRYYLRQLSDQEFTQLALPFLAGYIQPKNGQYQISGFKELQTWDRVVGIVTLEKQRVSKLSDIPPALNFIFASELKYPPELLFWKNMSKQEVKCNLQKTLEILTKIPATKFNAQTLQAKLMPVARAQQDLGRLLWPLRVALSGQKASPGPFEIAAALGKERSIKRLEQALALL